MKKINLNCLLILSLLFLALTACKKEDGGDDPTNHFRYNGKTYELSHGVLEYYGQWGGDGYNFDVNLLSEGFTYTGDDLSGTGHIVYFEMFSSSSGSLASGTYVFDAEYDQIPGTWTTANFGISVNVETYSGTFISVSKGTVKVSRDGSKYIFDFSFTTGDNKTISGYYKGTLDQLDWSWKKSKKLAWHD